MYSVSCCHSSFVGCAFTGAKLTDVVFFRTRLHGTDMREAELRHVRFEGAELVHVDFKNAQWGGVCVCVCI